ncbi:IclR family transcriptional regulator [Paenibacillus flagellatus]|uniref:IclR family transcriptional regulator n=1 Tax=Paenibacillus flagellatus TaxID=2211139 RepID=UPI001FE54E0E|nr:IclR family transcriptional regulator [Paenibacillus flagellatus]
MDNALELLEYFTRENPTWGVRELAKEMDMSHSIVHRILTTFESHGFLIQNQDTKKYELGTKLWEYGSIIRDNLRISDVIFPIMQRLSAETGESVFLTWLDYHEGICVEIAESPQKLKYAVSIGNRTPLYAGASNKAIMAFLPAEDQEAIIAKGLKPVTGKTVIDPAKLRDDLTVIRRNGWAYSVGEYSDSIFGIALPLFSNKGEVVASITLAGPEYRMPKSKVPDVLDTMRAKRDEIEACLHKMSFSYTSGRRAGG